MTARPRLSQPTSSDRDLEILLDAGRQASGTGWVGACLRCHRLDPRLGCLDAIPRGFKCRGIKAVEIERRPSGDSIREEIDAGLVECAPRTGVEVGRRLVPRACTAWAECLHKGHQRLMPCQGRRPWPLARKGCFEQENQVGADKVDGRCGWRRPEERT
jgi:hypothetical protein